MDLHHQGSKTDAEGRMVTGSTLWPNATATADELGIRPQFDQVVFRSKQVVSTLVEAVSRYGYANFSRYCGTTPPGISRNAYGLLGSASVLIEMRGDIGQKANGYIAKTAYVARPLRGRGAGRRQPLGGRRRRRRGAPADAQRDRLPAGGGGRRVASVSECTTAARQRP